MTCKKSYRTLDVLRHNTKCKKCGQNLPNYDLDPKTLKHIDRMLKTWVTLWMMGRNEKA